MKRCVSGTRMNDVLSLRKLIARDNGRPDKCYCCGLVPIYHSGYWCRHRFALIAHRRVRSRYVVLHQPTTLCIGGGRAKARPYRSIVDLLLLLTADAVTVLLLYHMCLRCARHNLGYHSGTRVKKTVIRWRRGGSNP